MQFRFDVPVFYRWAMMALIIGVLTATPFYSSAAQSQSRSQAGSSVTSNDIIYTVQVGDTLSSIARRFGIPTQALAKANNIVNVNFIYVGQPLTIPASEPILIPTQSSTTTLPPTSIPPTSIPTQPTPTQPAMPALPPTPAPTSSSTTTLPPTAVPSVEPSVEPTVEPTVAPTEVPITVASPWTDPTELVEVFSPVAQTSYHSPIQVVGLSRTFESTVSMRLVDASGFVLAERYATGGGVDGYDFFETYIRFFVNEPTNARLEFTQTAGEGDDLKVEASVEVTLLPGGQRGIDLLDPAINATICDEISVAGYSLTFEGSVPVALSERDGTELSVVPATGGGTSFRDWDIQLENPATNEPRALLLSVHESSARDGSTIDMTRIPISVYPAGHPACTE